MKLFRRPSPEPLWKDEFSIDTAEDRYVNRRQFSKFLVLTSLGMFVGNLWILGKAKLFKQPAYPLMRIGTVDEIGVGEVKVFNYPGEHDNCLLVRIAADKFVAYSQKCTHLSCAVFYSRERHELVCPCHDGFFSVTTGQVLRGPPPRPLPRIVIERRGNELFAVGVVIQRTGEHG